MAEWSLLWSILNDDDLYRITFPTASSRENKQGRNGMAYNSFVDMDKEIWQWVMQQPNRSSPRSDAFLQKVLLQAASTDAAARPRALTLAMLLIAELSKGGGV